MLAANNKTDAELVQLTLQDVEAFTYLIERYKKKLLRYIYRFSGIRPPEAEDILQEAFLKMYQNLNSFNFSLGFSAWAYRITRNETINYLRKNKKHQENISLSLSAEDKSIRDLLNVLADKTDLRQEISRKELAGKIRKILSLLPLNYREVLMLRFFEEKNYQEISDILRVPMGTVATLLNRAKKQAKILAEKDNLSFYLFTDE